MTILSDCMVIQALRSDTDKIDLVENKEIGIHVLERFADVLRQKGYEIKNTTLSSVGLVMDRNQWYKIVRTMDDRILNDNNLPLASAPFYIDRAVSHDSALYVHLGSVYDALINGHAGVGKTKSFVPEAVRLGKVTGDSVIAIVLSGGYNVPASKEFGVAAENRSLTSHVVAVKSTSHLSLMFFLLDARTGEVLWEDRRFKNGGTVVLEKYLSMVEGMLENLP